MVYIIGESRTLEWVTPVLPVLPSLCTICARSGSFNIVPDRDPEIFDRYDILCTVCIDAFCSLFPLSPGKIFEREITGKWNNKMKKLPKKT